MTHKDDLRRAEILFRYSEFVVQTEEQFLEVARAIRASDAEAGMVLVPKKPTMKMVLAIVKAHNDGRVQDIWGDTLAAHEEGADDAD